MYNSFLQGILSRPFLVHHAQYSFSVLLVHIWVLVSQSIYQLLQSLAPNHLLIFTLCFIICMVITHLLAMVFYQLFEKPSQNLANYVYKHTAK